MGLEKDYDQGKKDAIGNSGNNMIMRQTFIQKNKIEFVMTKNVMIKLLFKNKGHKKSVDKIEAMGIPEMLKRDKKSFYSAHLKY